jgi:hypothetical protein
LVKPLSPQRYRVQFTIGQEDYEKLKRLQALLRREVPDGDPGALFTGGLALLLEKVEKQKLGVRRGRGGTSGAGRGRGNYETRIRSGTDKDARERSGNPAGSGRDAGRCSGSRHIPNEVRWTV